MPRNNELIEKLEQEAFKKYPLVCVGGHRVEPMKVTPFGQVGIGWNSILIHLLARIQNHLEHNPKLQKGFRIAQVKEKYGTLRFYTDGGDAYIEGAIDMAEGMSCSTCELCGNPGTTKEKQGWVNTFCVPCRKK